MIPEMMLCVHIKSGYDFIDDVMSALRIWL